MKSRFKIFSDPVHGFISVPRGLILDLIQTPEVQRLRRIRQLGIGYLVFPGAEHSRFGHALGAMALMHDSLLALTEKGTEISREEHTSALAAALLHDIGHGPFSHTLENNLISGFRHEAMSRILLAGLNESFGGRLETALQIFDGDYPRRFLNQLVSSQLDMDRLDYLRRDSYYTGVVEGRVGVERIIKTLRVHPDTGGPEDRIVVEARGVHAVENFLIARRLMYWQVYLHKTVIAGDHLLRGIIRRVRMHLGNGDSALPEGASPAFLFFLENDITADDLDVADVRNNYCALDDTDLIYSIKCWRKSADPILADLCRRILDRDFFRVSYLDSQASDALKSIWTDRVRAYLKNAGLSTDETLEPDASYYLVFDQSDHSAYEHVENSIDVLQRDGSLIELSEAVRVSAIAGVSGRETRPYICYPKELGLLTLPESAL